MERKSLLVATIMAWLLGALVFALASPAHAQCGVPGGPKCAPDPEREKKPTATDRPRTPTPTLTHTPSPTATVTLTATAPPALPPAAPPLTSEPSGQPLTLYLLGGGLLLLLLLAALMLFRQGRAAASAARSGHPPGHSPPEPVAPSMVGPPDDGTPLMPTFYNTGAFKVDPADPSKPLMPTFPNTNGNIMITGELPGASAALNPDDPGMDMIDPSDPD